MASQEEEMTDNFDEEEEQPSEVHNPFNTSDPNKPAKPLLEEYREIREAEESHHVAERQHLEQRLRACLAQDPKLEIGKASAIQEKLANMTIEQLRFAVQAAEDKLGLSAPHVLPKATLKVVEKAANMALGVGLRPAAYEDQQLLSVIGRWLPSVSWQYGDLVQLAVRILEHFVYLGQEDPLPSPVAGGNSMAGINIADLNIPMGSPPEGGAYPK